MDFPSPRFRELFFALYEGLPRQGPGNRASAARALSLCRELPPAPRVIDLGCGVGGQTLLLAELTGGTIDALDLHAPSVERLARAVVERGLSGRVRPRVGDMAEPGAAPASYDLVWSEGALYNLGLERALPLCRGLLRPGGYLAFTEPVRRGEAAPPAEVKASFDLDYPAMGRAPAVLAAVARAGLELAGAFELPDEAWWEDFYGPMEARVAALRREHAGDPEALAVLDELAREPELHRRCSSWYAYLFVVARRRG